jgi:tetratricopeptide (TPR) repeat protein
MGEVRSRCTWLLVALFTLIVVQCSTADSAIRAELRLIQKIVDQKPVTVYTDTVELPLDATFTASMANVVADITVSSHTDEYATLRVETFTSGPGLKPYFETFKVPYGLPIIVDSVFSKGSSVFRFAVTPVELVETADEDCEFDPTNDQTFSSDPSPHYQIFFVPQSLGDFQWNSIRTFIEVEMDSLDGLYKFGESHPVYYYLLPCRYKDYQYDRVWGYHVDPSRNNIMVLHNHDEIGTSALPVNSLKFYRFWGYAPRFLVDGVSSTPDFNDYYVLSESLADRIPDLEQYFISDDFASYPDRGALRHVAGSFVGFLLKTRGLDKFKELYAISTDLTLGEDFKTVYGGTFDDLYRSWRGYLDTLRIDPRWFGYYAQRLSFLKDYEEAVALLEKQFRATGGSADLLEQLGNYSYILGRYDEAQAYYGLRLEDDELRPVNLLAYANMLLINGEVDAALEYYNKMLAVDSVSDVATYKIGRILQYLGDCEGAIERFHRAAELAPSDDIVIDAHIGIAQCYRSIGLSDSSRAYFVSALNGAKVNMYGSAPKQLMYMRAGEAFVSLGQPETAIEHLNRAYFVEERAFYIGRLALAMGQAYDLLGERDTALQYYQLVLDAPGGFLFREKATSFMSEPYSHAE